MRHIIFSLLVLAGIIHGYSENRTVHYIWFDHHDPEAIYEGEHLVNDIDVSELQDGLHTLGHVAVLSDGTLTPPRTSCFLKYADINASGVAACHVILDNSPAVRHECQVSDGLIHLDLDMSSLTDGLHQLTIFITPESGSTVIPPRTAYFVKNPVGGADIIRYCYWINSDTAEAVTVDCERPASRLDIVDLIEIPEHALNTSSYAFSVENAEIIMTAKHKFNLWAMDKAGRFSQTMTQHYVDRRTQWRFPIENIETLSSCSDRQTGEIKDNGIKWYKFNGEIGDSISLHLSQAAMYELYSPAGSSLMEKRGALSESVSSMTLQETGTYFLAVHDIASSIKNRLRLTFHHVPRNAILSVTPEAIYPTRLFTALELFGNGMSDAKKLIFENENGIRHEVDSLFAYDNYHLNTAIWHKDKLDAGNYNVSLVISDKISGEEKTICYPDVITVADSGNKADIDIEVIPSKKASTPYMVDIKVSNNSDVACWGIPFSVACERDGGKNGFVFYMKDFVGESIPLDSFEWYESDNILGTGKDGLYFPMVLDHMQPHESRTLKVGIISEPHAKVGLYAWAGEPYNEAADRLLSLPADSIASMEIMQSNLFNFENELYTAYVIDELAKNQDLSGSPEKNIGKKNDWVLEGLKDYGPDAIGRYKPIKPSADAAGLAESIAEANAHTFGGIANAGANAAVFHRWRQNGIPGNSIGEQLQYIYDMNMQYNPDIQNDVALVTKNMARSKSPKQIVTDLGRDQLPWWAKLTDSFCHSNASCSNPMPKKYDVESYQSKDPNMITGYTDPTGGNYIGLDVNQVYYSIEFENDPVLANASASTVFIENKLDSNVFDLSSLVPIDMQIGNKTIVLPSAKSFVITTDMRPEINCILETRLAYSEETGCGVWSFNSLDPVSLDPVQDFRQGFLPVNDDSGNGIGRIRYSVRLKKGLEHGTEISNCASITFDDNEPVVTPEWINTTDYEAPVARITNQYEHNGFYYSFDVEASDIGSGVSTYDLYARTDRSQEWSVVLSNLTEPHVEFHTDEPIENIEFSVKATDCAGNRQTQPDVTTDTDMIIENPTSGDTENWFDLNGINLRNDNIRKETGPIVSSKGRKVIVR